MDTILIWRYKLVADDKPKENEETQEDSSVKDDLRRVAKGEITFDAFIEDSQTKLTQYKQEQEIVNSNTLNFISTLSPVIDQLEALRDSSLDTTLRQSFIQFYAYVSILKRDVTNETTRINNEQL